jgi:hypothetical protein
MKEYTNNTKQIGKRIMCTARPESRAGRGASDFLLYSQAGYLHYRAQLGAAPFL